VGFGEDRGLLLVFWHIERIVALVALEASEGQKALKSYKTAESEGQLVYDMK